MQCITLCVHLCMQNNFSNIAQFASAILTSVHCDGSSVQIEGCKSAHTAATILIRERAALEATGGFRGT